MEQYISSHCTNGSRSATIGTEDLDVAARSLIQNAVDKRDRTFGFGSMSCSVYDTAWVSLVTKTINGKCEWLFPESTYYLLDSQSADGSWGKSTSQIDGILSTAASLLSLLRHEAQPLQLEDVGKLGLKARIAKAVDSLRSQLQSWSVTSTVHVGFEVIVPAVLDLIAKEDSSIQFQFDGFDDLMSINEEKLSRFQPDHLYGNKRSAILHSLEAFMDKVDFDRLAPHITFGSMMGSPSSTAAYLMSVSHWDNEAEAYLRHVIQHSAGEGSGGVPSAYPSTYFEYSWILSTLLTSGFSSADLESPGLHQMAGLLAQALEDEGGTIGFAPYFMADVDDTAKTIMCLRMLGKSASPASMIELFDAKDHFKTYPSERNPSFSANCNALLALLHQEVPEDYSPQITKIIGFLCDTWWTSIYKIKDKWNTSHLYPTLLLVEAVMRFVKLVEKGDLPALYDKIMHSRVAICLYQACYRTLLDQDDNGSWNNSVEETAYGTLILCQARHLDLFRDFEEQLCSAIDNAVAFIQSSKENHPQHLWVEKVSYTSPHLAETYRLAALKASTIRPVTRIGSSIREDTSVIPKLAKLWLRTPLFSGIPEWQIRASMVEGTLFRPIVRAQRLSVFTRKGVEVDKYFDVIPLAWPTCNNRTRIFAPPSFLFEGMMAALLNYQVDEFMEAVAGINYAEHIPELRRLIDDVILSISKESYVGNTYEASCHESARTATNGINGTTKGLDMIEKVNGHHLVIEESKHREVLVPLQKFVTRALKHPSILAASPWDRKNVTCELRIYLQTHVTQSEDNVRLKQNTFTDGVMREHFFRWVRTTSADHTSATYTFNFMSCLLSAWIEKGGDCFPSTQEKYYAAAACQHLATMCRMYNDHGSTIRDRDEGNLNSIDFPEFEHKTTTSGSDALAMKKANLFEVAQYERSSLEEALRRLEKHREKTNSAEAQARKRRQMDIWTLFYNVTDLFGQIYVLRDIGSRLNVGTAG